MSETESGTRTASGAQQAPSQLAGSQPTTIGGYALAIARALDHYGIDPGRVFRAVGIPETLGNDPMTRLPGDTMTQLFRACVDVTHDPCFGLTVARYIHISNLHALGYALAASSTLMDFCHRVVRYFRLATQTADITLEHAGDEVTLRWGLLADVCAETEDAFLGFLVLSMRQLHKPSVNPARVEFHHPCPREGDELYARLFRSPLVFGAPHPLLVLHRSDLEQPLLGACPEIAQHHDHVADTYLARLDRSDVITMVRKMLVEFLPTGECGRERVAQAMCMSPTTLQAKLLQRNTNFQMILDDTRRELACGYVQQVNRPLTEIAFLLGFSDSSNFTRAFKRWTGVSPSEYRLKHTV